MRFIESDEGLLSRNIVHGLSHICIYKARATQLRRMPRFPSSWARLRVIAANPALEAA